MRGLDPRIHLERRMDCRVKPGNDKTADNRERKGLTLTRTIAISTPPGTSGLLAFGWDKKMTGTTRSSDGLDDRRKRLLFRCWHRGTREMDLILGRFADAEISGLRDQELTELERLIDVPDPDLYAALTGDVPLDPEYAGALFERIKAFRAVDHDA
jgi:antitoxin CptB